MDILNRDVRILLLEKMDPIEVIQACQVDRAFRHACNAPGTFERLLHAHFPGSVRPRGMSARDFYNRAVEKSGSDWLLDVKVEIQGTSFDVHIEPYALYITQKEAETILNRDLITVRGMKLPRGKHWVFGTIFTTPTGKPSYRFSFQDTLAKAVHYFVEYHGLNIRSEIKNKYASVSKYSELQARYEEWAAENGIPDVASKKAVLEYVKTTGSIEIPDFGDYSSSWRSISWSLSIRANDSRGTTSPESN